MPSLSQYGIEPQKLILFDVLTTIATLYIMIEMGLVAIIDETQIQVYAIMYWLDVIVLIIYGAEILLEFKRGFYLRGRLFLDRKNIIKNYHWGRLLLDLLLVLLIGVTLIPAFRINPLRFIIFWRFYHLHRIDDSFFRLTHTNINWNVFYTFVKMVLVFYMFCHYMGCLYYYIDDLLIRLNYYGQNAYLQMWLYYQYLWSPIRGEVWNIQYLYTMYYSIETITTIAYGDNTPKNPIETAFVLCFLIMSAVMLSYILEIVVMIFFNFLKMRFMFLRKVKRMIIFMKLKGVDVSMKQRILVFYEYLYAETRLMKQQEIGMTVVRLSAELKGKLYGEIFSQYLLRSEFLRDIRNNIFAQLNNQIQQKIVLQGNIIYHPHHQDDAALYLTQTQTAEYYFQYNAKTPQVSLYRQRLTAFGEYEFLTNMPRIYGLRVLRQNIVYKFPRQAFIEAVKMDNSLLYQHMMQRKNQLLLKEDSIIDCQACKSQIHSEIECPSVHYCADQVLTVSKNQQGQNKRARLKRINQRHGMAKKCYRDMPERLNTEKAEIRQYVRKAEFFLMNQAEEFDAGGHAQAIDTCVDWQGYYPHWNLPQRFIYSL